MGWGGGRGEDERGGGLAGGQLVCAAEDRVCTRTKEIFKDFEKAKLILVIFCRICPRFVKLYID